MASRKIYRLWKPVDLSVLMVNLKTFNLEFQKRSQFQHFYQLVQSKSMNRKEEEKQSSTIASNREEEHDAEGLP